MKKLIIFSMILGALFCTCGCSIPTSANYNELYSFTRVEKRSKGMMGIKKSSETISDFRENEMYIEDITALKEEVEKYITQHPDLSDEIKSNMRQLKIAPGFNKEEVELMLGEPDKTGGNGNTWIYQISRLRAFTIFIFPIFFAHEGYYLRFDKDRLTAIERHYPKQIIHQASGPGLTTKKTSN
ncbi:MAG: hypothetical protein PHN59_01040 [Candidatus Omnitrophica bacterium]|nr:hypothetical protein [Candidatus Omnitrophota bacterium]